MCYNTLIIETYICMKQSYYIFNSCSTSLVYKHVYDIYYTHIVYGLSNNKINNHYHRYTRRPVCIHVDEADND